MSDEEIAALRKRVEELEAKAKPPEKSDFKPKSDAEWREEMHALAETRMSMATPPSVVRDWAVIPDHIVKGIVEDRHAPTSATGMIPSSQQRADVREQSSIVEAVVEAVREENARERADRRWGMNS